MGIENHLSSISQVEEQIDIEKLYGIQECPEEPGVDRLEACDVIVREDETLALISASATPMRSGGCSGLFGSRDIAEAPERNDADKIQVRSIFDKGDPNTVTVLPWEVFDEYAHPRELDVMLAGNTYDPNAENLEERYGRYADRILSGGVSLDELSGTIESIQSGSLYVFETPSDYYDGLSNRTNVIEGIEGAIEHFQDKGKVVSMPVHHFHGRTGDFKADIYYTPDINLFEITEKTSGKQSRVYLSDGIYQKISEDANPLGLTQNEFSEVDLTARALSAE